MLVSQFKLPLSWTISGRECKYLTLTQIAALPDGFYELVKCSKWCAKSEHWKWVAPQIDAALDQEHLREPVKAAVAQYKKVGGWIGKAKVYRKREASEFADRNLERGLFS